MPTRKTTAKKAAKKTPRRRGPATARNVRLAPANTRDINAAPDFLQKAWKKLEDMVVDLTTVDVTTFQGNITVNVEPNGKFNPSAFFQSLQGEIASGSTLSLVAHTHVDFDLDSVVITKPDADTTLMDAHNKAVQTAVDARMSVVRYLKDLF